MSAEPRPRVSVIIPASNLRDVLATLPQDLHEVLIVGGGSEAAAIECARNLRPDIRIVRQAGGDALATGLTDCTGDVVVILGTRADSAVLSRFVDALTAGVALAKRPHGNDGGSSTQPPPRRARNWLLCGLVNVMQSPVA
jgi:hypothetical protein